MPASGSPRMVAAAAGIVLVLGPVALIQIYRGAAAPADAGAVPARPAPPPAPKDAFRLAPEARGAGPGPDAALLFAPGSGVRQSFVRPAPAEAPPAPFAFSRPRAAEQGLAQEASADAPSSSPGLVPADPAARRPPARTGARDRVTRSASCDERMPENAWLDVCG